MAVLGTELIKAMESFSPPALAVSNDPIGLQIGNEAAPVKGILVCLDVTTDVVKEAIDKGANWIIAHHAVIFKAVDQIRVDSVQGKLLAELLRHDLNVYIAHTNLDAADEGVNDILAQQLGLEACEVLWSYKQEQLLKLVVFVPVSHYEQVLQSLGDAGAGWIGNYSYCTFGVEGTGTFYPQKGARPYLGQPGHLEKVREIRLETILKEQDQEAVLSALIAAHPYEEVAYDLYPLRNAGRKWGIGRVGSLPQPTTLGKLAALAKEIYDLKGLRFVGDASRVVQQVAIVGGAGKSLLNKVLQKNLDVYITGDLDYHTARLALASGLSLIDIGHYAERQVLPLLAQRLRGFWSDQVPVYISQALDDPFCFLV